MRQTIRKLGLKIAPGITSNILVWRHRRHIDRVVSAAGIPRVAEAVCEFYNNTVADGPFKSMKYLSDASGSTVAPKILGAYEAEITPWIERLISAGLDTFIDVGCAEGYYAVGLAMRLPQATVHAFDIDPVARSRCATLAALNGVEPRVKIQGRCNAADLDRLISGRSLLIVDIEGFEDRLLDLVEARRLASAAMLIELHEGANPGVSDRIRERFRSTHTIEEVPTQPRDAQAFPAANFLPEADRKVALDEMRGSPQTWVLLTPR